MPLRLVIRERLLQVMNLRRITIDGLAKRSGLSPKTVERMVAGTTFSPESYEQVETVLRIELTDAATLGPRREAATADQRVFQRIERVRRAVQGVRTALVGVGQALDLVDYTLNLAQRASEDEPVEGVEPACE